jgi:hypothetical protein
MMEESLRPAVAMDRRTAMLFREVAERAPATSQPAPEDVRAGDASVLVCALCATPITTSADRIEVDGGHEHFEVNPHGVAFRFGCFASAANLVPVTPPERAWSWFPGYAWRVVACAGCGSHLGWLFLAETQRFHGLLLDALIEDERRPS